MRHVRCLLSLALVACGPIKPGDAGPDASTGGPASTADSDGVTMGGAATTTAPGSTGGLDPTTGLGGGTTGGTTGDTTGRPGDDTSTGDDASTGTVEGPPTDVVILVFQPFSDGEGHAFTVLPPWQPGNMPPDCEGSLPVCDRNTAPAFAAPWMFLNDMWVDPATPVHVGDRVGIAYPFADAECNVTCGSYIASVTTPDSGGDTGGSLEEMPCTQGSAVGLEFSEVDEPGVYEYSLRLFDACEAQGELMGKFEVLP